MQFPSLPGDLDEQLSTISFDVVDVELPQLDEEVLSLWLTAVAKTHDCTIASLGYVFCSDAYLLEMNVERLEHDTYTDIITFDLSDAEGLPIEGECYISLERVAENAASFGVRFERELLRVVVHGLLHLCGLGDKTPEDASSMRIAEDSALAEYFI